MYKNIEKKRITKLDMRNEVDKVRIADLFIFLSLLFQIIVNLIQVFTEPSLELNRLLFFNDYVLLISIILYFITIGINRHFLMFSFIVCFFIFLMGQKPFRYEYGYDLFHTFVQLQLSPSQYLIFVNLLYFSLFTAFIGYRCVYEKCKRKKKRDMEIAEDSKILNEQFFKQYRNILRVLFCFCFICALISELETLTLKSAVTYEEGYLLSIDHNIIVKLGSYLFPGVYFMYLTARPKFLEMTCVSFAYLIVKGVLQLFTGGRIGFASVVLFLIWYTICYFRLDKKKMPNRYIIYLGVFGVVFIMLFWLVQSNRGGGDSGLDLIGAISGFLTSTGGSDSVIANTIAKADSFPKSGIIYFISPITENISHIFQKIVGIITGVDVPVYAQGIEYLQNHDAFAHWISYIVSPEMYLAGHGMGSSYIAETYLAFGFVGIILCGLILGVVIAKMSTIDVHSNSVFKNAIILFFISKVFTLPRAGFFDSIFTFIYMLVAIFLVWFCLFVMGQKIKNLPLKSCTKQM